MGIVLITLGVYYIGASLGILMQASLVGGLKRVAWLAFALPVFIPFQVVAYSIEKKKISYLRLLVHMDTLAILFLKLLNKHLRKMPRRCSEHDITKMKCYTSNWRESLGALEKCIQGQVA
ncbi:MAG TPA: hypothetical protein VN608_09280 [Clostridia bacterium]|nr:hypothetical protein [Clostridia bacterium]